ncbi:uncharacterized protein G2W53_027929 [Senna tora]|uniref:Uncharacterized protein n=1 Tax=Senna tora TaxID=362788 RepID=A0A834T3I0_9FABA|nr:uncharacterized protein G2W53_027929 [Senna tora]
MRLKLRQRREAHPQMAFGKSESEDEPELDNERVGVAA